MCMENHSQVYEIRQVEVNRILIFFVFLLLAPGQKSGLKRSSDHVLCLGWLIGEVLPPTQHG